MRFNKISIPDAITKEKGIKEINLSRLGSVVAFIGKNGSGKTRILDLLEENLFDGITIGKLLEMPLKDLPEVVQASISNIQNHKQAIIIREKIENLKADKNNEILSVLNQEFRKLTAGRPFSTAVEQNIATAKKNFVQHKVKLLRRINYTEIQSLQGILNQASDASITFESLIENQSEITDYNEFASIHRTGLKYLAKLPHQLTYDYMDCMGDETKYKTRASHKRFISIKNLVKNFLGKDLTWERKSTNNTYTDEGVQSMFSGEWKIDNRAFNYLEFSDGEKLLFSYAMLFFLLDQNPKLKIKNCIILVDEPELHLHPDSEIDLINGLRNVIGETGQLIFSTHSINILSNLNYDEVFMVRNGEIKHPSSSTIGDSLSELMNLEERVSKLSDFLSSVATWTYVNFMAECFSSPEVIESSNKNDPQVAAFKQAVINHSNYESNILLDFGAGKGRLYEQIKEDHNFINNINYSALEPETKFHDRLNELGAKNVYENHNQLPENSFDFVLLCNVLHEIPILEWVSTLNKVIHSIRNDGYLIIIEAKVLTKGERIGKEGFILLDIDEIKILFDLEEPPASIHIPGKENVITCAVISKANLENINLQSLTNTLVALEKNTLEKIIDLRQTNETYNSTLLGRKNAFLSQLHINSKIAQLTINNSHGEKGRIRRRAIK